MRRSTPRTASRYSVSLGGRFAEVRPADARPRRVTESRMLFCWTHAAQPLFRAGAAAVAEQAFEHQARIVLCRQRRGGALPSDRVCVRAGVTGVAGARRFAGFDGQFERSQLRMLAHLLRENLVHRDAGIEPRFTGGRRNVGEKPRAGFRVRAARPPRRRDAGKAAQHLEICRDTARARSTSASARTRRLRSMATSSA